MTANGSPTPAVRRRPLAAPGEAQRPVAVGRSVTPRADTVVHGLQPSPMFGLTVQAYRSHQRDCAGRCRSCAGGTCRSRAYAATIIAAAGANPAEVDAHPRCGFTSRRRRNLTTAGGRSHLRANGARVVRSRLSPEGRGRSRLASRSTRSRRDQPLGREAMTAVRRPLVSTAKESSVHSELVHLARLIDPYPLCGRLFCRCGARFSRWGSPDSKREYMTVCGCRMRPIDADTIERRVHADAARRDPALTASRWPELPAEVLAHLYTRIEIGGTVDDVRFVPRT